MIKTDHATEVNPPQPIDGQQAQVLRDILPLQTTLTPHES